MKLYSGRKVTRIVSEEIAQRLLLSLRRVLNLYGAPWSEPSVDVMEALFTGTNILAEHYIRDSGNLFFSDSKK